MISWFSFLETGLNYNPFLIHYGRERWAEENAEGSEFFLIWLLRFGNLSALDYVYLLYGKFILV